jgi:hypothetical protein
MNQASRLISGEIVGLIVKRKNERSRTNKRIEVDIASEYEFNLKTQISEITGKDIATTLGRKIIQSKGFNDLKPLSASRLSKKPETGRRIMIQIIFTA